MAVGLQRSGDWLAARRSDQCVVPPANHRCAVGLLTAIAAREFRLLKYYVEWFCTRNCGFCTRNCGAGRPHVGLCPALLPKNVHLGGSIWALITFFVCRPKFTYFFAQRGRGRIVDKIGIGLLFRFEIRGWVLEIFAIKVESCHKSSRILDVFSRSQILAGGPSKTYTHFITLASRHVAWKKFCEDTPTSPEVIGAHTLNFKPNFEF